MAFRRHRQRGVAVVTALLLTTLAVTIVASLFWQQQVQVRSIENQRLQLQKQWILRGALDWARLILRENARMANYDSLDQPWAVPLQDTRLDQYVENNRADTESSDATLSGQMVDAQSLYNLTNLAPNGQIDDKEVKVFARLLASQRLNPSLAQDTAAMLAASRASQAPVAAAPGTEQNIDPLTGLPRANPNPNPNPGAAGNPGAGTVAVNSQRLMPMTQVEDLLAVPGFTPEAVEKLRNLVIFLPQGKTKININTAPPEVLAAVIENISMSEAARIVAIRNTASFRTATDLGNDLRTVLPSVPDSVKNVCSEFFLVNGRVKLDRAALQIQALLKRTRTGVGACAAGPSKTQLVWIREN